MRKILFIIAALVCAGTLNLFAEDTRTVITECSFTGFDPSLVKVEQTIGHAKANLLYSIKIQEGAVYRISQTMLNISKWDDTTQAFARLDDLDEVVTKGVYYFYFQVRIDNQSGEGYGGAYRFPKSGEGCVTFTMNGESWGESCSATVDENYSYVTVFSPAFLVGYDDDHFKEDGNLPGVFSVAADKYIQFAQGNLQYQCADKEWKFAEAQYDVIGADNTNIAEDYDGWIDLFGWGTSGYNGRNPWLNTTNDTDYGNPDNYNKANIAGTNYDWGVYNAISNGGNEAGLWRTLTKDEWKYLFAERENAAALRSKATVAGKEGLILLPDDWDTIAKPLAATLNNFTDVTLTVKAWLAWEVAGAVFLPKAGMRYPYNGTYSGASCTYATGTFDQSYSSYRNCFTFDLSYATTADGIGTASYQTGAAVRLAKDVSRIYKVTIVTENCTVTVEPEGINLNAVEQGTVLTLTAVPETNFRFKEWQNYNPETGLVVTSDTTITAICAKLWVVTKAEVTGGHVSITYRDTDHELTADELSSVPDGTMLTFTAIPDEGYRFVGWTPASAYASTTYIVNQAITYDFTVTPVFRRNGVFAVTIQPRYGGEVTCTTEGVNLEEVESGTKLTFKANPIAGWSVNRWAGSPNLVVNYETTPDIAELTVTTDETITCYFAELPPVEAIDDIQSDEVQGTKILRDGELLIIRNGKTYNALGAEIK